MTQIRCTYNTRLAGWMSALVATATFSYLHSAYDRLPIVVPISFDAGSPLQFAMKSPGLVYLPFGLQVTLGLIFASVVAVLLAGRTPTGWDGARRAAVQHTAEGVALLAAVWITFQAVNAWRLTELWRRTFDPHVEIFVVALFTAFNATLIVAARVVLKVTAENGGEQPLTAPVVDRRRPLATAALAALLALGAAAPMALLAVVWQMLRQF